jgi:hypothetical protein
LFGGRAEVAELIACIGCGALVPDIEGPTHRYIGASPGCWQIYSEMRARGYGGESERHVPWTVHRLVVDTYAAQHPGVPGKQSSQSVAAHLFVLCLVIERGVDLAFVTQAITQFVERYKGREFAWVEPPPSLGPVTVLDVVAAGSREEHNRVVMRWAESVWRAWEVYHGRVRGWVGEWER